MLSKTKLAVERLYDHDCSTFEYREIEVNHITKHQEVKVLENQPCRMSFSSKKAAIQGEFVNTVNQTIVLFISPNIKIKNGSKIVVNHNGVETAYKNSGEPAIYDSHQEIYLELFKDWS